jgi:AcrR family transcriptional regulator
MEVEPAGQGGSARPHRSRTRLRVAKPQREPRAAWRYGRRMKCLGMTSVLETNLGPRGASKRQTRVDIIAAGIKLFERFGYDAVTTQQIADAAGVTQRTLFRHFERKDAIIYEAEYDHIAVFERKLNEAMGKFEQPFDAIQDALRSLVLYYDENKENIIKVYLIVKSSSYLSSIERGNQFKIDNLIAYAFDGGEMYFSNDRRASLRARILSSMLMASFRPMLRGWLTGELTGSLQGYAELGWTCIAPTMAAAEGYYQALDRYVKR